MAPPPSISFLARALQQQGYDRAASINTMSLVHRLANPTHESCATTPTHRISRQTPKGHLAADRRCLRKHEQYADALAAYEPLAKYEFG